MTDRDNYYVYYKESRGVADIARASCIHPPRIVRIHIPQVLIHVIRGDGIDVNTRRVATHLCARRRIERGSIYASASGFCDAVTFYIYSAIHV